MAKTKSLVLVQNKKAVELGLNPKQKRFCELYTSSEEFFANGTQSYIHAYNPTKKGNWYLSAMTSAYDLLRKPYICEYINHLLEMRGLNDGFVDKQLEFLITQHANFKAKLGGIQEYNKLRKRIDDSPKTLVLVHANEISIKRYDDRNKSKTRSQ